MPTQNAPMLSRSTSVSPLGISKGSGLPNDWSETLDPYHIISQIIIILLFCNKLVKMNDSPFVILLPLLYFVINAKSV